MAGDSGQRMAFDAGRNRLDNELAPNPQVPAKQHPSADGLSSAAVSAASSVRTAGARWRAAFQEGGRPAGEAIPRSRNRTGHRRESSFGLLPISRWAARRTAPSPPGNAKSWGTGGFQGADGPASADSVCITGAAPISVLQHTSVAVNAAHGAGGALPTISRLLF